MRHPYAAWILAGGLLLSASAAQAQLQRVEARVKGMDWAVCAAALQKAAQRLDGVEKVTISLNQGLMIINLKPQNRFSLDVLKRRVKDSGFTAGTVEITAAGEITRSGNRSAFKVGGRNDLIFLLAPVANRNLPSMKTTGADTLVTGTVVESRKKGVPDTLRVQKIETPKK